MASELVNLLLAIGVGFGTLITLTITFTRSVMRDRDKANERAEAAEEEAKELLNELTTRTKESICELKQAHDDIILANKNTMKAQSALQETDAKFNIRIQNMTQENTDQINELTSMWEARHDTQNERIARLEAALDEATKSRDALRERMEKLIEEKAKLEQVLAERTVELNKTRKQVDLELEQSQKAITILTTGQESRDREIAQLNKNIDKLRDEVRKLQNKNKSISEKRSQTTQVKRPIDKEKNEE